MSFSCVAPCLGRSQIDAKGGGKFYRQEVQRKVCGHRWDRVEEDHFGGACRRSEIVGGELVCLRKNIFRPASDTLPGQERGRKARPRTEDCCVSGAIKNRRTEIAALLLHALDHGEMRADLIAWRELVLGVQWTVCRREIVVAWCWGFLLGFERARRKLGLRPGEEGVGIREKVGYLRGLPRSR